MGIIILFFLILFGLPTIMMATAEVKTVPTHDDCSHVTVTTFKGLVKVFDGEMCGDKHISLTIDRHPPPPAQE